MNYSKIKQVLFPSLLLFILSCDSPAVSFNRIEYNIPGHININEDDLKGALSGIETDSASSVYIVVTLYSYSSGSETISFSGGDDVKTVSGKGRIKALLKVMDGKKIIRAEFAEGGGSSKEEMIASLVKEFKLKMEGR
jgi:hypothetical protein